MNIMICLRGEPEHLPYLPEIAGLGAGIELGSYGLVGIRSAQDWETRLALHETVRAQFDGDLAIHGPFFGMEYMHMDYLIREVVLRRLDMTYAVAAKLKARRVILHSGYQPENDIFNLREPWLKENIAFWQQEIRRWAEAGITIVIENDTETSPDVLVRLADGVDSPFLGLCLDIGHQHVFSDLGALEWVRRMGERLFHVHLHDNDRRGDHHWSIGRGTIDFEPFYALVLEQVPNVTISLEVVDNMEVKMGDLRNLVARFALESK